tara:strand:- start:470 stop:733 length:264 start_codon:yes stop_codon:yes gene_type:complete
MKENILRDFIREEVGRNLRTVNTNPYTFGDMGDYDIEIVPHREGKFYLTIRLGGEKITPVSVYSSHDEAMHASRMVIDKDRVTRMNT